MYHARLAHYKFASGTKQHTHAAATHHQSFLQRIALFCDLATPCISIPNPDSVQNSVGRPSPAQCLWFAQSLAAYPPDHDTSKPRLGKSLMIGPQATPSSSPHLTSPHLTSPLLEWRSTAWKIDTTLQLILACPLPCSLPPASDPYPALASTWSSRRSSALDRDSFSLALWALFTCPK